MARKVGNISVIPRAVVPCGTPGAKYLGPKASSYIILIGFQRIPINRPFHVLSRFDRDIDIPLRHGVKLLADIFCLVHNKKVPALLVWSPYGKSGAGFFNPEFVPSCSGVAASKISSMKKSEGLDPTEWVGRCYAIANGDPRGVFKSEGDIV